MIWLRMQSKVEIQLLLATWAAVEKGVFASSCWVPWSMTILAEASGETKHLGSAEVSPCVF